MKSLGVSTMFSTSFDELRSLASNGRVKEEGSIGVSVFSRHRGWKYERLSCKCNAEGGERGKRERERERNEGGKEVTLLQHDVQMHSANGPVAPCTVHRALIQCMAYRLPSTFLSDFCPLLNSFEPFQYLLPAPRLVFAKLNIYLFLFFSLSFSSVARF